MTNRERRVVMLGLCGALLAAFLSYGLFLFRSTPGRDSGKMESKLYYRLFEGQDVRFSVRARAPSLRITARPVAGETTRDLRFGLRLQATSPGKDPWTRDVFFEVPSVEDWPTNAPRTEGDLRIGPSRLLFVEVPEEIGSPFELRVGALGNAHEIAVVVERQEPRQPSAQRALARRLEPQSTEKLVARSSAVPWAYLTWSERHRRLRFRYERIPAVGKAGINYLTRLIRSEAREYYPESSKVTDAFPLYAGNARAINIRGPSDVRYFVTPQVEGESVSVHVRSDFGGGAEVDAERGVIRLGGGVHSLIFADQRLTVLGDEPPVFLPSDRVIANIELKAESKGWITHQSKTGAVSPAVTQFPVYELRSEQALDFSVVPSRSSMPSVLRFDVRRAFLSAAVGNAPIELRATALDANGNELSQQNETLEAPFAPFERLFDAEGRRVGVTESVSFYVSPPPKAARIRLTSETLLLIRPYVEQNEKWEVDVPYKDEELFATRWRYAPMVKRRWVPIRPEKHHALYREGRQWRFKADTRLALLGDAGDEDFALGIASDEPELIALEGSKPRALYTRSLVPVGALGRARIREPWEYRRGKYGGVLSPLPAKRVTAVVTSEQRDSLRVRYEAEAAHLGTEVRLWLGNRPERRIVTSTVGEWSYDVPITQRRFALRHDSPPDVQLFARAAPFVASEVWRERTLYRVGKIAKVRVFHDGIRTTATLVVYTEDAASEDPRQLRFRWSNLEKSSDLLGMHRSREQWQTSLAPSDRQAAVFLAQDRPSVFPHHVKSVLGSDVAAGYYTLEVEFLKPGYRWVRVFATNQAGKMHAHDLQWKDWK